MAGRHGHRLRWPVFDPRLCKLIGSHYSSFLKVPSEMVVSMWEIRVTHEDLHAYRVIRGVSKEEAEVKARLQLEAWNVRWKRRQETEAARQKRLHQKALFDKQVDCDKRAKQHALELTREAEANIAAVRSLLKDSLRKDRSFNWDGLKDTTTFTKDRPVAPQLQSLPQEPLRTDDQFRSKPVTATISFLDSIIPGARKKKLTVAEVTERQRRTEADQRFQEAHAEWKRRTEEIARLNESAISNHAKSEAAWVLEKHVFEEHQMQYNQSIDDLREKYSKRSPEAVVRLTWTG